MLPFTIFIVGANQAKSLVLVADSSRVVNQLAELPGFVLLGGLTILALRVESVTFESIGVSRYHARSGIVAVASVVLAVNVVVVVLALVIGNKLSFELHAQYARTLDAGSILIVVGAVISYLSTGSPASDDEEGAHSISYLTLSKKFLEIHRESK